MKLCTKCVSPDTRPNVNFDERGVCPACQYQEQRRGQKIDWEARHRELAEICEWGRRNTKSTYDCIVTVSGGKDSTRQACYARDELGMNPLLVNCCYPPEQLSERGADNLGNLMTLGFDTLSLTLNPVLWKRLMQEGFQRFGNWAKSTEMALYAIPVHVAIAYQIPLLFYGENPLHIFGENCGRTDGDASRLKKGNTINGGPASLLPGDTTAQDSHFYYYPPDEHMDAAKLRLVYLGYYMEDWSMRRNGEFSIARGLKTRPEPPEITGDLWGFTCLDEDYSIVNQMLKYLKFGFGRVTDQVCELINTGEITREQALELVNKYDGKCDASFIQRFCHYLEITEGEFWQVAERYRNLDVWKKDEAGKWQLQVTA